MGEDQENTREVLVDYIGAYDPERVKFLQCQDYEDEMEAAMELLGQLYEKAGFHDLAIFKQGVTL
jgi:altronate dehydratase